MVCVFVKFIEIFNFRSFYFVFFKLVTSNKSAVAQVAGGDMVFRVATAEESAKMMNILGGLKRRAWFRIQRHRLYHFS